MYISTCCRRNCCCCCCRLIWSAWRLCWSLWERRTRSELGGCFDL